MTISSIIGPVDVFSAAVAIGVIVATAIVLTTLLARTTGQKLKMDFELAKMKQHQDAEAVRHKQDIDRETILSKMVANKEVEFKRIESGMVDLKTVQSSNYDSEG